MELRHLRYFVALADTLSFTRAAETLYVSQSTLSQQIASFERELGCKLFERNHRQVMLTDAGRSLLVEARDILGHVDGLATCAKSSISPASHTRLLRVSFDARVSGSDIIRDALTDRIFTLRQQYPQLHADFSTGEYDDVVKSLTEGGCDLAFFLHQKPAIKASGSFVSRCLYEDELVLAIRCSETLEDIPERLSEILDRYGVTLLEGEGRGTIQALRIFEDLGVSPKVHFVSSRLAMQMALNCGERPGVMPLGLLKRLASPDVQRLRFRQPSSRLYVLAAWHASSSSLVLDAVDAVDQALAPWRELREAELGHATPRA